MKYTEKTFAVAVGGEKYGEGWDRIFGTKAEETPRLQATHRCKVCGALWALIPPTAPGLCCPSTCASCLNGWWSVLTPEIMGKCCDNVAMGEQIEPIQ